MTSGTPPFPDIDVDRIDLSDMAFWAGPRDVREATFEALREIEGLVHFEERVLEDFPFPPGDGYYALARHEDIWHVSRNPTLMFYNSGNRDERVFRDPYVFDIARPLQPAQVGFGAGGPHFCLGANLARREMMVMFDEIRRRLPSLRITGEPEYLQSNFINGIKRMQCSWD